MSSEQQLARITTPSDREIRIERMFDAPREAVWDAIVDPELVVQWWGPRGTTTTVDRWEVRGGTDWRLLITSADGRQNGFRGTFREVSAPERIVRTFEWEGMPGHIAVETMVLEQVGPATRLEVRSLFHTTEERDGMLASGMERGTNDSYGRLDEVLARRTVAA
jgi:uncharacterized protein YndB with AHSA1/START domain